MRKCKVLLKVGFLQVYRNRCGSGRLPLHGSQPGEIPLRSNNGSEDALGKGGLLERGYQGSSRVPQEGGDRTTGGGERDRTDGRHRPQDGPLTAARIDLLNPTRRAYNKIPSKLILSIFL